MKNSERIWNGLRARLRHSLERLSKITGQVTGVARTALGTVACYAGFEVIDFGCYYLPVTLWDDKSFQPFEQRLPYQHIHKAASILPFYSYAPMFFGTKEDGTTAVPMKRASLLPSPALS